VVPAMIVEPFATTGRHASVLTPAGLPLNQGVRTTCFRHPEAQA
jgi:hypothetical protein